MAAEVCDAEREVDERTAYSREALAREVARGVAAAESAAQELQACRRRHDEEMCALVEACERRHGEELAASKAREEQERKRAVTAEAHLLRAAATRDQLARLVGRVLGKLGVPALDPALPLPSLPDTLPPWRPPSPPREIKSPSWTPIRSLPAAPQPSPGKQWTPPRPPVPSGDLSRPPPSAVPLEPTAGITSSSEHDAATLAVAAARDCESGGGGDCDAVAVAPTDCEAEGEAARPDRMQAGSSLSLEGTALVPLPARGRPAVLFLPRDAALVVGESIEHELLQASWSSSVPLCVHHRHCLRLHSAAPAPSPAPPPPPAAAPFAAAAL